MITIVAKQTVKQGKIDSFIAIAKKLVEKTHQSDVGCISYDLFQDSQNSGVLSFIEEWENQEALDKHMASRHFRELFPQLDEFLEKPGEINLYQKVE
ncbi:MAG TPA: putative quinol monooxygenase [Methylomusa anaerophila]|uniref:Putative monooxygenase n=1 Tax=Methylomusa anaerophila TaxID=1930071 RepID=A0A348AN43_9FIRM|nr:putative quinol monooxygenase [Methylomusa anaerophila]BBB92491.1 putative monooxygenase [Methylomusa anaerophila]HML87657.1 putative quinol monooxygenase [Methylomusa anaerophila]